MGFVETFIEFILFACFGVYFVMGLALAIMGGVYMGEVGEASSFGLALMVVGVFMLLVGAGALFATYKKNGILLYVASPRGHGSSNTV
jgi:hypothetical protein